jgi:histidinol-phosphatase (PHP family)
MLPEQLEGYVDSVLGLRERYTGRLEISLGLEAEFNPDYMGWLDDIRGRYGLDYLIFGNHYDKIDEAVYYGVITQPEFVRRYGVKAISGIESGRFDCFAHPDLFLMNYPCFDMDCRSVSRDICASARDNSVPLEFNLSGFQHPARGVRGLGYPSYEFWQIAAQEGVRAVIGLDAHSPERLGEIGLYDLAVQYLFALGIPCVISLSRQKVPAASIA